MYIGVDLGTVFSQAATMHNGHPLVLLPIDTYGIPSEFYYDAEIGIQLGQDALDYAVGINSKHLVSECKMKLLNVPDEITLDGCSFKYSDMVRHIYSYVLQTSMRIAQTKLINGNIDGIVLTMPVRFGYKEKSILKEAAQKCLGGVDLKIIDVLKEPVAAAISYYKDSLDDGKTVLVFDLGGGTCDIALVRSDKSTRELFTVIDDGMERVGGRDWDAALMEYISKEVENKTGIRIIDHDLYRQQLKTQAVEVKKKLSDGISTSAAAQINMQNGHIVRVPITLTLFEEITHELMMRALDCLKDVYAKNIADYNIDEIICVGGSSNMRQVRYNIQKEFPEVTVRLYEPEHAVVNGAAIYADLACKYPEPVLSDVSAFSYGVHAYEDYDKDPEKLIIANIIHKGDSLPAAGSRTLATVIPDQGYMSLRIFESEITDSQYDIDRPSTYIGKVSFPLPNGAPKNYEVRCEIKLNGDGFLYFTARDNAGNTIPATFQLST